MKIEATLDDKGHLEFARPLRLKHGRVRVLVTVPDDEIQEPLTSNDQKPEVDPRARAMLEGLDAIRNAPVPADEDLPEWTAKQQERLEAFDLRSAMHTKQGRPD